MVTIESVKTKPAKKYSKFPEREKVASPKVPSPAQPRVHLLYNSTMRKADTRCGTGDKKRVTTKLREVTCPLCRYWAGKS